MLKHKYLSGFLLISFLYWSCEKKETFDIQGATAVKFYTNLESAGNAPPNSRTYNIVNIPQATGDLLTNLSSNFTSMVKFPVFATRPVSEDVIIAAELDNALVAAYNSANNREYEPFPAGFFYNPMSLSAKLLKGSTISMDSISLAADLSKLSTLTGTDYMAPIKLTTVSKPAVGEITSNAAIKVVYIVASVEQRKIKFNAVAAEAQGSLISPRTSWTVLFTPAVTTVGSIFDGSTTTFSRWPNGTSPGQVDVNIQTQRNVTGIRLYTTNSSTLIPTQIDVYLSTDGINYDLIGSPLRANLTYASSYNYILFYKAIPAKFIRLKLYYGTSTNTQNFRVTEFDVYAL